MAQEKNTSTIEKLLTKEGPLKEEEYHKLKAYAKTHVTKKTPLLHKVLFFIFFDGGIAALIFYIVTNSEQFYWLSERELQGAIILFVSFLFAMHMWAFSIANILNSMKTKRHNTIQEKLYEYDLSHTQDEVEENLFKNSIKISYKYLDQYYALTREHAKKGFSITKNVAIGGAVLIGVGVVSLLIGFTTPAYITCASGVITEFISSIFFAMYNKTVTSMNSYHDKLVLSQNIAFALRVADSLTETNKDAAKLEIIKELMKDVNAQMMKSDADDTEPPKKKPSSDAETPSGNE
ncbi:MAG: hypothetical protein IJQ81_03570 [Oscillibacter sp.]|nr:hypothetical protein [Oscillibacter sp.]